MNRQALEQTIAQLRDAIAREQANVLAEREAMGYYTRDGEWMPNRTQYAGWGTTVDNLMDELQELERSLQELA